MSLPLMSLINSMSQTDFPNPIQRQMLTRSILHTPEKVLILTVDGRTLLGTLLSTDQLTNIVLTNTVERIIRTPDDDEPSAQVEHGLYLIRGDNVVVCGEIDEKIDADIDWSKVKGQVIRDTKNA
ncbi:U6 snRNA-associated Sm-like protein LSm8 [Penicillium rolfsii]|nr:U6 snRNA-associated Sm-like protein LSm8 [Penicillium rolfsii]